MHEAKNQTSVKNIEHDNKHYQSKMYVADSSDEGYCYTVNGQDNVNEIKPNVSVKLNNISVNIMVDTGASVNILDENMYTKLGKPKLMKHSPSHLTYMEVVILYQL